MKQTFLIAFMTVLIWSCSSDHPNTIDYNSDVNSMVDTNQYSLQSIESLHQRLTLKEYDKSLTEFIHSNPHRVDSVHKVVYILPFGNMKSEVEKLIHEEVEYLQAFLQLEVRVLDRMSYDSMRNINSIQTRLVSRGEFEYYSKMKGGTPALTEQIQANSFVEAVLKHSKPKDAVALLGITEHDIYNPGYNFLFGVSTLKEGLGVVSTFRLIDYGEGTRYNLRKVISKQIVNIFSIPNVKDYECLMNFHNSLSELNSGKFDLSPRALEKLKYAIGFEYSKRFSDLARFWTKENNKKEKKYYEECLRKLKKVRQE